MQVIIELFFLLIDFINGPKKIRKSLKPVYVVYSVVSVCFIVWIALG